MSNPISDKEENLFLIQNDINKHITSQEDLYKKLKNSEFVLDVDKQTLTSTSVNNDIVSIDNINNKLSDLSNEGNEISKEVKFQELINNYFNYYYNENTKLRHTYFEKINKLNKKLLSQKEELQKLQPQLNKLQTSSSTNYRELKENKRKLAEQKYYKELFTIIMFTQLFIIIILILAITRTIPKMTCIMISTIFYILLSIYVFYVVLFTNVDRDVVVFDKYKFPIDKDSISKCDTSALSKLQKNKDTELQNKLVNLLNDRNSRTHCLTEGTSVTSTTSTTIPVINTTTSTTPVL
jgi:hypothetical protein